MPHTSLQLDDEDSTLSMAQDPLVTRANRFEREWFFALSNAQAILQFS